MLFRLVIGIRVLLVPLAAVACFAQTRAGQPAPHALSTIFGTPFASTLATADTAPPSISPNGVVPIYSSATTIQPGEWVSIYGSSLATTTQSWNNDFPQNLGGTKVTINGKPAYLYFVSPTIIDLQAPDDTATGSVPVVVTTANGQSTATVTLGQFGPSFSVLGAKYVAGIIFRTDGSGTQGGGAYDIIGPTGTSLGFQTVAAKAGDTVELFGVGFGPTTPAIPSGQALASGVFGTALPSNGIQLIINGKSLTPSFAGITQAGVYQFNLTIPPGLGTGDATIVGTAGGLQTPSGIFIALQ